MGEFKGEEKWSALRRCIMYMAYLVVALSIYGIWQDFVPTDRWVHIGFYLSLFLAVIVTILLIYLNESGILELYKNVKKSRKFFSYVFFGPVIFYFFWTATVHGTAGIVTRAAGSQSIIQTTVVKELSYNSRRLRLRCENRLDLVQMDNGFPAYLCADSSIFSSLESRSKIRMVGKSSFFGFAVVSWAPVSANK